MQNQTSRTSRKERSSATAGTTGRTRTGHAQDEFSRYPNGDWLRTQEQRHDQQNSSQQDTPAVGTPAGAPSVQTPERTPRRGTSWRWRSLLVLVAVLTSWTTYDLVVQDPGTPGRADAPHGSHIWGVR